LRIVLEKISLEDSDRIAKWKSDPTLATLIMSNSNAVSDSDAKDWIQRNSSDPNQRLNGIYLENDCSKELLGITRLMFIDFVSEVAELGIYLGDETKRGIGLGKKAMLLTVDQAFKELKLRKLYLKVNANNEKALALYLKFEFKTEGVLKEHYYNSNACRFEDIVYMALFNRDNT
jgi:RimJ/RimL family protein N-acetyltransferase